MNKTINAILIVITSLMLAAAGSITYMKYNDFQASQNKLQNIDCEKLSSLAEKHESYINQAQKYYRQALSENLDEEEYAHKYMLGDIAFISFTDTWDESMLEELSNELLKNKHGEELNYLSQVQVYGEEGDRYLGYQETTKQSYQIPLSFYDLLPHDSLFTVNSNLSILALMDGDEITTIEDMAHVLSHEYGHHFTEYHFGLTYTDYDKNTRYYRLRGEGYDDIRFNLSDSVTEYYDNHMWYLFEIGAEDYAYLMGSDTGKQIVEFYDTYDKLNAYSTSESRFNRIDYSYVPSLNGTPHENTVLPMPSQVPGLAEYFYSFIDEDTPEYLHTESIGDLNLTVEKPSKNHYKITWDKPYTDEDVIYTLLVCDETERIWFIEKSVWGNETAKANMGSFEVTKGNWIYSLRTGVKKGTKLYLKVSITFPDGSVLVSDSTELIY